MADDRVKTIQETARRLFVDAPPSYRAAVKDSWIQFARNPILQVDGVYLRNDKIACRGRINLKWTATLVGYVSLPPSLLRDIIPSWKQEQFPLFWAISPDNGFQSLVLLVPLGHSVFREAKEVELRPVDQKLLEALYAVNPSLCETYTLFFARLLNEIRRRHLETGALIEEGLGLLPLPTLPI